MPSQSQEIIPAPKTVEEAPLLLMKRDPSAPLNAVYDEFTSLTDECTRCGETFKFHENSLYSCHGHTGSLVLDHVITAQNLSIGLALGAAAGTCIGVATGVAILGKTLVSGGVIAGKMSLFGAAGAATAPTEAGILLGSGVGAASGGVCSLISNHAKCAYVWSCCGHLESQKKCPGRTSMHIPKHMMERNLCRSVPSENKDDGKA